MIYANVEAARKAAQRRSKSEGLKISIYRQKFEREDGTRDFVFLVTGSENLRPDLWETDREWTRYEGLARTDEDGDLHARLVEIETYLSCLTAAQVDEVFQGGPTRRKVGKLNDELSIIKNEVGRRIKLERGSIR